jgi:hypothetical protein
MQYKVVNSLYHRITPLTGLLRMRCFGDKYCYNIGAESF